VTIQLSVIDFSALPEWPAPARVKALADMHSQLDVHHRLRGMMGASIVPPVCGVHPLGNSLILVSRVVS
jgi:hypothetical protein